MEKIDFALVGVAREFAPAIKSALPRSRFFSQSATSERKGT
ncbi:hypothetical protein AB395_00002450 [Sinorhizobium fredii CCBAU 45436]|nr:hypothetical protein SF83666_c24830 [Sinorhizobium fredii CCBAU 83666]AWI58102.1 hypothetical protein AB395_00002450 [Sinorhizobium fredii CCBAU 45436]